MEAIVALSLGYGLMILVPGVHCYMVIEMVIERCTLSDAITIDL